MSHLRIVVLLLSVLVLLSFVLDGAYAQDISQGSDNTTQPLVNCFSRNYTDIGRCCYWQGLYSIDDAGVESCACQGVGVSGDRCQYNAVSMTIGGIISAILLIGSLLFAQVLAKSKDIWLWIQKKRLGTSSRSSATIRNQDKQALTEQDEL